MHLSRFPRVRLAHLPTPLEPMDRLSGELGGPRLWVKRDDATGLGTGGNKTRKLEFLMADGLSEGADVVITQGALQSNHVRQTAAAAAKLGVDCHVLLENRVTTDDPDYRLSGNVLLDQMFGATISERPAGANMNAEMELLAEQLKAGGKTPYIIPGGGSNRVGALGYVNCAFELVGQANDLDLVIDHVVHATGSTGTQAGLVAGLQALNSGIETLGISVRAEKTQQEENVFRLAAETADYIGAPGSVARTDIVANSDYVGGGYGVPTDSMIEAVTLAARMEGLLFDPVYSGKGLAGLFDLVRRGHFQAAKNVVFIHTGGSAALFAYRSTFAG